MDPETGIPTTQANGAERVSLFGDLDLTRASQAQQESVLESEDLEVSTREDSLSPVLSLVDRMLIEALTGNASDIHVEPQEDGLVIRFRQDGVLHVVEKLPRSLTPRSRRG